MSASLPPSIKFQPIVSGGPLPNGKVKFYKSGTSTPQTVYAADGVTPIGSEITLDANGSADFRFGDGLTYKVELLDANNVLQLNWPVDKVRGADQTGLIEALSDRTDVLATDLAAKDAAVRADFHAADEASAATLTTAYRSADQTVTDNFQAADLDLNTKITSAKVDITALQVGQNSAVVGYATKALLTADLTPADKAVAYVTNDPTPANNGTYRKSGASGAGSWVQSSFDRVALVETLSNATAASVADVKNETTSEILPMLWGVADAAGYLALGVHSDGSTRVANMRPEKTTMDDTVTETTRTPAVAWGVTDNDGNIALGVTEDGKVIAPGLQAVVPDIPASTYEPLTVATSESIAHVGDSYTASHYTLKDKAYISVLSSLSPYRHRCFGVSGNDALDMAYRIRTGSSLVDGVPLKNMNASYAFLATYTNDGYMWTAGWPYYAENLGRLVETVRAAGPEPILCTEFATSEIGWGVVRSVASHYGLRFCNPDGIEAEVGSAVGAFHQGHPGTRTNGVFWGPMLAAVDALPRPNKSLKIFRHRPTFTVSAISDLLYHDRLDRAARWKELGLTHYYLDTASAPYYDELNGPNVYTQAQASDEYVSLENKLPVAFADYALLEMVLPGTAATLDTLTLTFGLGPGVAVYVRDYFDATAGLPGKNLGGGVLPTDSAYLAKWDQPRGAWVQLTSGYTGAITLTDLAGRLNYDTLQILLYKAGGFSMTDVQADYTGPLGKIRTRPVEKPAATGAELLAAPTFTSAALAGWTGISAPGWLVPCDSTAAPRDPANIANPVPGVCVIGAGQSVAQSVTLPNPGTAGRRYRVSVWARNFPKAFVDNSVYGFPAGQVVDRIANPGSPTITSDGCDLRTLVLEWAPGAIPGSGTSVQRGVVGLAWLPVDFDIYCPPAPRGGTSTTIRLSCSDGEIQLAKVSVKEVL